MKKFLVLLTSLLLVIGLGFALASCGNKVTVTFDTDGGSVVKPVTIEKGQKVTKPADPTKDGFTFTAWLDGDKAFDFETKVEKSLTLKASYKQNEAAKAKFTVKFDLNYEKAEAQNPAEVVEGEKVAQPAAPTRQGYKFLGWYTDKEGKTQFNFDNAVTANVELFAMWEMEKTPDPQPQPQPAQEFTVTFDSKGGSAVASVTVKEGEKVAQPAAPTLADNNFEGWYKDEAYSSVFDFASEVVSSNVTLYAKWSPVAPTPVAVDTTALEAKIQEAKAKLSENLEMYTQTSVDALKDAVAAAEAALAEDPKDAAKVEASVQALTEKSQLVVDENKVEVTFVVGTEKSVKYLTKDVKVTLEAPQVGAKERFLGWSLEGAKVEDFTPTKNVELVADVKEVITVTFNYGYQDSPAPVVKEFIKGAQLEKAELTRKGYDLEKFVVGEETSSKEFTLGAAEEDLVVFAKWTEKDPAAKTAESKEDLTAEIAKVEELVSSPVFAAYTSATQDEVNQALQAAKDAKDLPTADSTSLDAALADVVAKVNALAQDETKVVVTFVNGDEKTVSVIDKGTKVSKPQPDPAKDHMVFKGWNKDGQEFDFDQVVEENLELTAVYVEGVYVTFTKGPGDTVTFKTPYDQPMLIEKGSLVTEPSVDDMIIASNSKFTGFLVNGKDIEKFDFSKPILEDTVINTSSANYTEKELTNINRTKLQELIAQVQAKVDEPFYSQIYLQPGAQQLVDELAKAKEKLEDKSASSQDLLDAYNELKAKLDALQKDNNARTVTFTLPEGVTFVDPTAKATRIVRKGQLVPNPGKAAKEKSEFQGWYNNGVKWDFDTDVVDGDLSLVPMFKAYEKVSFDPANGKSAQVFEVLTGEKVTTPVLTPKKLNYKFVGWFTEEGTKFDTAVDVVPAGGVALVAKYEMMNEAERIAEMKEMLAQLIAETQTVVTREDYLKYTVGTRNRLEARLALAIDFQTNVTADTTLQDYLIQFNQLESALRGQSGRDGLIRDSHQVVFHFILDGRLTMSYPGVEQTDRIAVMPKGMTPNEWYAAKSATVPVPAPQPNLEFKGWHQVVNRNGEPTVNQLGMFFPDPIILDHQYDFDAVLNDELNGNFLQDVYLYPQFVKQVTVTFEAGEGKLPDETQTPVTLAAGSKVKDPGAATKENARFLGYFAEGSDVPYDFNTPVTDNLTLTPKFVNTFKVTFEADRWSELPALDVNNPLVVDENEKVSNPGVATTTLEGKIFQGWAEKPAPKPEVKGVSITYVVEDDEEAFEPTLVIAGEVGEKPSYDPAAQDKRFVGWFTQPNGEEMFDFGQPVNENVKVYAKFEDQPSTPVPEDYAEKLAARNDAQDEKNRVVREKVKASQGNEDESEALPLYNFDTPITKDITLIPVFKQQYTVTYDFDGGLSESPTEVKVFKNEVAPTPVKPTKEGFEFKEWQKDDAKYDFETKVTSNITLKAVYSARIPVTFDVLGNQTEVIVAEGNQVAKPEEEPKSEGYIFVDWLVEEASYDFTTPVTKPITIKAKFVKVHLVSFTGFLNMTNGEVFRYNTAFKTDKAGQISAQGSISDESLVGYTFVGWRKSTDPKDAPTVTETRTEVYTSNVVYEAVFAKK